MASSCRKPITRVEERDDLRAPFSLTEGEGRGEGGRGRLGPHHSRTWSARRSGDGGIVRPSALAVRALMTSSNIVGCSIGWSAGLAPLRILSAKPTGRVQGGRPSLARVQSFDYAPGCWQDRPARGEELSWRCMLAMLYALMIQSSSPLRQVELQLGLTAPDVQDESLVAAWVAHSLNTFSASPHCHCAAVLIDPPPTRLSIHSPIN